MVENDIMDQWVNVDYLFVFIIFAFSETKSYSLYPWLAWDAQCRPGWT